MDVTDKRQVLKLGSDHKLELSQESVKEKKVSEKKYYQSLSIASELGLSLAIPLAGGAFLGSFLDSKFHTTPKLTLSLIFLGLFIGVVNIYYIIKDIDKK